LDGASSEIYLTEESVNPESKLASTPLPVAWIIVYEIDLQWSYQARATDGQPNNTPASNHAPYSISDSLHQST
jgi:hypothetical protein